ncbi:vitamin B12 dependent-methionine synthase activation domain-containing protein [Desulfuribacillus alkaliarsenatis]|uniref:Uncharacterized protein n=1 Tax=Desulfuribacillus alkaliarsenatis TaxID=766136 RepID=A0A1E5G522_9FIRM|nr:vitamin B12 dependent-methionine synthase activation domain-containing protein [Desulfuribacillus alkaliarsenatis]OEF98263.1 hypothetical protein BHF68_00835 [Desulfuribacillus alkaliarsenatis]
MIFPHVPITIKVSEVNRYLGFKKNKSETTEEIDELIESMLKQAKYILEPKGMIRHAKIVTKDPKKFEITCTDSNVAEHGKDVHASYIIRSEKVYKHLAECEAITLLGVTIGEQIDMEIDRLFKEQQPTKALILDAIGSDAVERVADYVDDYVKKEAKRKGYGTRFRYSPGYGGWSVENQQDLINYLGGNEIGIKTTEHSQLIPRKSVSAIIGWYPLTHTNNGLSEQESADQETKCKMCDSVDCQIRDS